MRVKTIAFVQREILGEVLAVAVDPALEHPESDSFELDKLLISSYDVVF